MKENDKTVWDLVAEVSNKCKKKGELYNESEPHPYAFGAMTGVLAWLPDTPENRLFLENWLAQNTQS